MIQDVISLLKRDVEPENNPFSSVVLYSFSEKHHGSRSVLQVLALGQSSISSSSDAQVQWVRLFEKELELLRRQAESYEAI